LFRLLLGLAYMCGVFFSCIYVADLRRDSVSVYFEKRGVTESIKFLSPLLRERRQIVESR